MSYRIPNMRATNDMGKVIKRCMLCGAPGEWHYPEGSLCTKCALKSGMLSNR